MKEHMIIQGLKIEVENIAYESVKPMKQKPIKTLTCCCCGQETLGRQWWNRDTGYGLCAKCAEHISTSRGYKDDPIDFELCYGKKGIHHSLEENRI